MSAQPEDQQMEGVEQPVGAIEKGKGKVEGVEDSAEDDSSDESGAEEQVAEEVAEDDDAEIDPSNILGSRTRNRDIDFRKANEELGEEDEEDEEDEEYHEPQDEEMQD